MNLKEELSMDELSGASGGMALQCSVYVVQQGDTISSIAQKLGMNPLFLMQMNNLPDMTTPLTPDTKLLVTQ